MAAQALAGRLVPFLGAGVSFSARHDDAGWDDGHKTPKMRSRVREALLRRAWPGGAIASVLWDRLAAESDARQATLQLGEVCELFVDEIAASSVGGEDDAYGELVGILRISELANLQPTPAHRYIAFLAREGLVAEVITTNYDCCVERAFLESEGLRWAEARGSVDERLGRVWSLESFRARGSRDVPVYSHGVGASRRGLRVFKINGCALALLHDPRLGPSILLTERQLQDWGARRWAGDLFRERLRTSSVVFSGFGSPEPQIRHTVRQVLEEFEPAPEAAGDGGLLDRANCVFVTGFSRAETPSFPQWQIAAAFAAAHGRRGEAMDLVFGPADADHLVEYGSRPGSDVLPADKLWCWIYRRAARELLRRALDPRHGRFVAELLGCLETAPAFAVRLRRRVTGDADGGGAWESTRWLEALLEWDEARQTTRASLILRALLGCPDAEDGNLRGWYAPLSDYGSLLGWLLLVVEALGAGPDALAFDEEAGVLVRWGRPGTPPLSIAACDPGALLAPGRSGPGRRRLTQLVLDHPVPRAHEGRVRLPERRAGPEADGPSPLDHASRVRVRLTRVLHHHGDFIQSWEDLGQLLRDVARFPTRYVREEVPLARRRLDGPATVEARSDLPPN
jgi:hypothetical protein